MVQDSAGLVKTHLWSIVLPAIGLGTVIYWTGSFMYWLFT